MSRGFEDSGETGRLRERLLGVDSRIAEFVMGILDIYDKMAAGDRLGECTDQQLSDVQAGLGEFSGIISVEQQYRRQAQQLTELFGMKQPEPARMAAVVDLATRDAAPEVMDDTYDGTDKEKPHQTESGFAVDLKPVSQDNTALVIDRPSRRNQEPQHIVMNGVSVAVYDKYVADILRILTSSPGETMKRDDFINKGFASSLKAGSSRGQAFGAAFRELARQEGLLETLSIKSIGKGAGRRYVYQSPNGETIPVPEIEPDPETKAEVAIEEIPPSGSEHEIAELVGGTDILHAPAGEQISAEPEDEGLPSGLEVSVSSKGLAVVLLEDGQVKIRFRGQQLTGLEKFGSLPGYVLLALSLQIYGDKTHVDDLSERAERLGGEIDRNLTTEVLRAMSRNIQVEGKPLIKEVGGNSWALSYAVRRTREECIEVLNRLGLSDAQSNRFLA